MNRPDPYGGHHLTLSGHRINRYVVSRDLIDIAPENVSTWFRNLANPLH